MKYIDADILLKEIGKRLKNIRDYMAGHGMKYQGPKYYKAQGKESAYDAILNIIDSLQQESDKNLEEAAEKYRRASCNAAMKPNIDGPIPEYGGSVAFHYPEHVPTGVKYKSPQCYTDVLITPNTNSGKSTLKAEG